MRRNNAQDGFTLIELMIGLALNLVVLAAVYNLFVSQTRTYALQDQIVEMQQEARSGLDMIVSALQMAGYDPQGTQAFGVTAYVGNDFPASNSPGLALTTNTELYFTSDQNENGVIDNTWDERFGFRVNGGNLQMAIISNVDGSISSWESIADNIESLTVSYTYADGSVSTDVGLPDNSVAGRNLGDIRAVTISVTARTSKPDPLYTHPTFGDGYRRMTLTSEVRPRNIGL
jgi:type IV pilus assembly protein PilW